MAEYIVIVFHHGGVLVRNEDGLLTYLNGKVDNPSSVNDDFVNLRDIEMIFKDYGYETCKSILWLHPGYTDLELGLKPLNNDSDINVTCEAALGHGNEVHVYFDNCISIAEIVQSDEEKDEEEKDEDPHADRDEEKGEVEEECFEFKDEDNKEDEERKDLATLTTSMSLNQNELCCVRD